MNCFIAMAFFRKDTDRLYDTTLTEILREKGITPVRVDRVEHNDDIDDRIVREIREASFMIADLTFARPSVYYEAGFAEREIPVIYTVRRDHFTPPVDDKFGNLGVHFDLSMKNILDWNDPDDPVFRQRLASRIDFVTRPIRERLDAGQENQRQCQIFEALSTRQQSEAISSTASAILKNYGYLDRNDVERAGWATGYGADEWYLVDNDCYHWLRFRYPEDTLDHVDSGIWRYNLNVGASLSRAKRIREQWIYATPGKAKLEEARDRLNNFKKLPANPVFSTEDFEKRFDIVVRPGWST